jgi:hypothetical protein
MLSLDDLGGTKTARGVFPRSSGKSSSTFPELCFRITRVTVHIAGSTTFQALLQNLLASFRDIRSDVTKASSLGV